MSLRDGTPVSNLDESGSPDDLKKTDREKEFLTSGIPTTPTLIFPENTDSVEVYVGRELLDSFSQNVHRIFWKVNQ